jgi:hypothetical protein
MYAFLILIMPLGYLALAAWFWDAPLQDRSGRMFIRGIVLSLPALLIWHFSSRLLPPGWGSAWLWVHFSVVLWVIPLLLCTGAYALVRNLSGMERGTDFKPFVAFTFGFMTSFCIALAIRYWSIRLPAYTVVLPILTVTGCLVYASAFEEAIKDNLPKGLLWIGLIITVLGINGLAMAMFFLRLEWLGWVLAGASSGPSLYFAFRRLHRRP